MRNRIHRKSIKRKIEKKNGNNKERQEKQEKKGQTGKAKGKINEKWEEKTYHIIDSNGES